MSWENMEFIKIYMTNLFSLRIATFHRWILKRNSIDLIKFRILFFIRIIIFFLLSYGTREIYKKV